MLNKVQLIGRIGLIKPGTTQSGKSVTQFTVATTESWLNKQTDQWEESTEWSTIVSFNKCAEHIRDKIKVGDLIFLEGKKHTRKWQIDQGQDRSTVEILIKDFPKKLPRYWTQNGEQSASKQPSHQPMAASAGQAQSAYSGPALDSRFDDDIPF